MFIMCLKHLNGNVGIILNIDHNYINTASDTITIIYNRSIIRFDDVPFVI